MVSILHYNGIYDPTKIEKFLGKNEDYYEVMIDGKIEKLKIPNFQHIEEGLQKKLGKIHKFEEIEEIVLPSIEELESQIKQLDKNIEKLEKLESFTNNLEEVVEHIKKDHPLLVTTKIIKIPVVPKEEVVSFEDELKKSEIENEEFLESVKKEVKPKTKKVTKPKTKKIEAIESKEKKIDDDINDFIDTI